MILVVDDDKRWREIYGDILADYELDFAEDGLEAMQKINTRVPKLMILDILMAGPNGFNLLNELISYPELQQIAVILISSVARPEMRELSQFNIVGVLDKATMRPEDIRSLVREAQTK